jgi:type VI protein secretion system component VasK
MMVEMYGFIAVSVIAWAWLALLYWFLTRDKADHERRLNNLERHEDRRKAEEEAENEEVADEIERMMSEGAKDYRKRKRSA